jgi:tetratricopeptide (TPR) repeat protein
MGAAVFDRAAATAQREAGNAHFKAGRYEEAESSYADALRLLSASRSSAVGSEDAADRVSLDEEQSKCRLNRCACLLRLQGYAAARAEAEAVIALSDGSSAKAYFRLGQALERLHEPRFAAAALTQAIRLDPKAREPREALELSRSRLKAHPRLELVLDDLRLVEERAVRALVHADLSRARQQMELMLKDARAQAATLGGDATHWECRALLGLALVCAEEAEGEAALDYTAACRRRLAHCLSLGKDDAPSGDLRIEAFHAHVSAQLCLYAHKPADALPLVAVGLAVGATMRDDATRLRLLGVRAVAYGALGDSYGSESTAREALEVAVSTGNAYGETISHLALGRSLRAQGKVHSAAASLRRAFEGAFTLGAAHALAAAHTAYAVLQLDYGEPTRQRVASAMEKLGKVRRRPGG